MQVSIEAEVKAAERQLYNYEKKAIPRAVNRSLNTTARNVQTTITRHIAKQTGLKVGEVKKNTQIRKSTFLTLTASLTGRRRAFNLYRFLQPRNRSFLPGAFSNRPGVKANPWRKSRTFRGTFIIRGRTHGKPIVVTRTSKNRYPLKGVYGPSIHVEFNRPRSRRIMIVTSKRRFAINFKRDLNYYVQRVG